MKSRGVSSGSTPGVGVGEWGGFPSLGASPPFTRQQAARHRGEHDYVTARETFA